MKTTEFLSQKIPNVTYYTDTSICFDDVTLSFFEGEWHLFKKGALKHSTKRGVVQAAIRNPSYLGDPVFKIFKDLEGSLFEAGFLISDYMEGLDVSYGDTGMFVTSPHGQIVVDFIPSRGVFSSYIYDYGETFESEKLLKSIYRAVEFWQGCLIGAAEETTAYQEKLRYWAYK